MKSGRGPISAAILRRIHQWTEEPMRKGEPDRSYVLRMIDTGLITVEKAKQITRTVEAEYKAKGKS